MKHGCIYLILALGWGTQNGCGGTSTADSQGQSTGNEGGIGDLTGEPTSTTSSSEVPDQKLDIGNISAGQATMAGDPFDTEGCADVVAKVEPVIPTLVLLLDKSGSMTADFAGQQRWEAIYETLMDPINGVVATLQSQVRFGLSLYTSNNGSLNGDECPIIAGIEPALDNLMPMEALFAADGPPTNGETPTGESLAVITQELDAFAADGPKGIVLATDGEPDTCAVPNPQNGQPESIAAATDAYALGIETYIISVGDQVGEQHLQEMANVGVGKPVNDPVGAPYYQALNAQQLVEAFEEIIGTFVSCQLTIEGEVNLDQACDGTVTLDGVELDCNTEFHLPDPMTLELLGGACDTVKDGETHDIVASWPCEAINIP